jgi:predicted neuraminidase
MSLSCTRRAALQLAGGALLARSFGRPAAAAPASPIPVERLREFVYAEAPFPECHASTLVETREGLLAAWFGGTREGRDDVVIYTSRRGAEAWSAPVQVTDGRMAGDPRQYPCWNPVLFQPREGPLLLFYKVGPRPNSWWGMIRTSTDQGRTWSPPRRLPEGQLGPVRAKPIQLADGTLLCGSSTEHAGWQVQMETTRDPLGEWSRTPPLNRAEEWGAIQPTLLPHGGGVIQILCRSRQKVILESWSFDSGKTWTPLAGTPLPNPSSGIDAVRLKDGRFVLVYNHTPQGRGVLNLAVSEDGRKWRAAAVLEREEGEFSYPALIETRDGLVHAMYTWNRRRLRHVVLDPARLDGGPIVDGRWPGEEAGR